jgi:hypothetical protein
MECEESRLGTPVLDVTRLGSEASKASNVDNMAMVSSYHGRQEVLHKQYRCDDVYVKNFADLGLGTSEHRHSVANSSVVNEHCRVAMFRDNLLGDFGDFDGVREVS